METIKVKGEIITTFHSFNDWVNKASSRLGGFAAHPGEVVVCVDIKGYICHIGEDFMKARDNDRFPVKAYRMVRSVRVENGKKECPRCDTQLPEGAIECTRCGYQYF